MAYTTIDNPELHFQTKLYTGNGSSNQAITFDGSENMKPDWVWIKTRDTTHQHTLIDSVRGANKALLSNSSAIEDTDDQYGWLSSFNTNGFTTQDGSASAHWNVNKTSENYVCWNWKAGGTASSNSNGSITSSVSANTTAGFSIVSYTGNGSVGSTVGHGLSSAPEMVITKDRNATYPWGVYHIGLDTTSPEDKYIELNNTAGAADFNYWNDTKPSNSVVTLGSSAANTTNGNNIIMYCFHSVKGYSKFGSFIGNGSSDGTYVYLGFRPSFILYKISSATSDWYLQDNKRLTYNVNSTRLEANNSDAEVTGAADKIDMLSNGFKMRHTSSSFNNSGKTYLYYAVAESPFVNSNGIPNNAR